MKYEIQIEGMSCGHCVMAVKKELSKLQGIENTHEAQDGLTKAIAGAYAHSLGEAKAAAKAKQWQTALDAYTAAYGFKPTDEAQKGIADMKKKLGQ